MRKLWARWPPNAIGYSSPAWRRSLNCLRQDDEKQAEWSKQLGDVQSEINAILRTLRFRRRRPSAGRGKPKPQRDAANGTRDTAVQNARWIEDPAEQYEKLTVQVRTAERQHDVHKKLDTVLGQNGCNGNWSVMPSSRSSSWPTTRSKTFRRRIIPRTG